MDTHDRLLTVQLQHVLDTGGQFCVTKFAGSLGVIVGAESVHNSVLTLNNNASRVWV